MTMPPFPTHPAPQDWWEAAMTLYTVPSWWTTPVHHADPLGRIAARARDIMRTNHCRTPAYLAFLAEQDRVRRLAEERANAARAAAAAARTAQERAEEAAFYADGGTAVEWAIRQEAADQAKADNAKMPPSCGARAAVEAPRL